MAALTFAASKGHLEIVRHLIQHGALVNAVDHSDSSALVEAAKNGHLDIVGHLASNCEWSTDSVHDLGWYTVLVKLQNLNNILKITNFIVILWSYRTKL